MKPKVLSKIRASYSSLSSAHKNIASYILEHSDKVVQLTILELADQCNTSEATIYRFIRKFGYRSYQVFRIDIAQDSSTHDREPLEEITKNDTTEMIMRKIVNASNTALSDLLTIITSTVVDKVSEKITTAKKIFVCGLGASAYISGDLYHKLIRLGINVSYSSDPHIIAIHVSQMDESDVVICVSHSGESNAILQSLEMLQTPSPTVVSITSYPYSSLARKSDFVLLSSSRETSYRPDAMVSRILQLVIIDMLTIRCLFLIGENAYDRIQSSRVAVARQKR